MEEGRKGSLEGEGNLRRRREEEKKKERHRK